MLEFQNVSFNYSQTEVIHNLSLKLVNNGVTAVIGPSGCGKTTIIKLIAGLLEPSSGEFITDFSRDNISYVFQDYRLLPWCNVYENVAVGLVRSGISLPEKKRCINSILSLVSMASYADRYPFELSGGMQQRVGLARALASSPELLLMDEPFSAVDGQTRQLLVQEFTALRHRKTMTVLLVTHQFQDVIDLADRVILLGSNPTTDLKTIDVKQFIRQKGASALCDEMWRVLKKDVSLAMQRTVSC
nr:ABC transporter ATP-binding protein [Endozoicomonas sp.]